MNINILVPLVSFLAYYILLVLTWFFGHSRAGKRFVLFLLPAMAWSLSSFALRANLLSEYADIWARILVLGILATAVTYYHFVRAFQNRRGGIGVYLGYSGLGIFTILAALGYIPRSVSVSNGMIYMDRGPLLYPFALLTFCFVAVAILSLRRRYTTLTSPLERTRTLYLLMGMGILTVFTLSNLSDTLSTYSIDHIGNVANSALICYAILRHRLLEVSLVIRKGLAYSASTFSMTALYFFSLFLLQKLFQDWQGLNQMVAVGVTAVLAAAFLRPITNNVQEFVDRLFLGMSYDYRQSLAQFSSKMGHILDLGELAQSMLQLTTKAVGATQASLLLPSNGTFSSQFACRLRAGEPVTWMKLDKGSPIVTWLAREGRALSRESMDIIPEFKALWERETREIDAVGCELLCPLVNKDRLVGILALGKKERGSSYNSEDLDLLMSVACDVAVLVENARQHTAIKVEVNTDGLTGLFNHRFFHDRVIEEIRRSSRFGLTFSMVMFDLDLFKTYNDAYGHLAGDAVLRQVAEFITNSMRRSDLAFRYGGEEFTVLLPEASADEAYRVAERIRKTVETRLEAAGVMLTVSAGVASWPKDAVMAEELIRCADSALYYAKRTGRDCTRLFSQLPVSASEQLETWGAGTLSMVYALAATVDAKDHYTYGHSRKVSKYVATIGEALGLNEEQITVLRNSGLLHDIGKIGISDAVLRKPGPLTKEEWKQIRSHPELGMAILRHADQLAECLPAIVHHHERFDGSGYPLGLRGESIPAEARILAVADAYDAMTSARSYRSALTTQEALDELVRGAGKQFDPKLVERLVALSKSSSPWQTDTWQPEAALDTVLRAV